MVLHGDNLPLGDPIRNTLAKFSCLLHMVIGPVCRLRAEEQENILDENLEGDLTQ